MSGNEIVGILPELPKEDLNNILVHTEAFWARLKEKTLFITGGTGFFGMWLSESFAWANDQFGLQAKLIILTRSPDAFRNRARWLTANPAVRLYQGDMDSFAFPEEDISYVIHAATESQAAGINAPLQFIRNVNGTKRVLDLCVARQVERILFTSSGAIYGSQPATLRHIPEEYEGAPSTTDVRSAYGQSKRASEFLCTVYAKDYGFKALIARCFAFVGPFLPLESNYAIGNFIRDALSDKPIHISGDGTPCRSYLYGADLAIWLWTILFNGTSCYPYNVGSEEEITIAGLAKEVARVLSPRTSIHVSGRTELGKKGERYVPLTLRARSGLGLVVNTELPDAILRTATWYSNYFSRRISKDNI